MRRLVPRVALGFCGVLILCAEIGAQPEEIPVRIEPQEARIGPFYSGFDLHVSANVDRNFDVVVVVVGSSSRLILQRKTRVWGLFWVPTENVTFDGVPSLYLLRSTTDLSGVAPAEVLESLGVGYEALRPRLGPGRREDLFHELVRLKESEGLFQCSIGVAKRPAIDQGDQPTTIILYVPSRASPAMYTVRLYGFHNGELMVSGHGAFRVNRGAFIDLAASLAEKHGLLYGIFAVFAALAAGLLVGLLFGLGKKR